MAVVAKSVGECSGYFSIAEDGGAFAEGQVGGDNNAGVHIKEYVAE